MYRCHLQTDYHPLTDITYVETSLSRWIMCHACYTGHSPTHIWNKTIHLLICKIQLNVGITIYYECDSWWSGHNQFWGMILALYSRDWGKKKHKNINVSISNSTADSNLELPKLQSSCSVCWQQIKQKIKGSHLKHPMYKQKWKVSCKSHKYLHHPTAIYKNINSQFNSLSWIQKIQYPVTHFQVHKNDI